MRVFEELALLFHPMDVETRIERASAVAVI